MSLLFLKQLLVIYSNFIRLSYIFLTLCDNIATNLLPRLLEKPVAVYHFVRIIIILCKMCNKMQCFDFLPEQYTPQLHDCRGYYMHIYTEIANI